MSLRGYLGQAFEDYKEFGRAVESEFDGEPKSVTEILAADVDSALPQLESIEEKLVQRIERASYEVILNNDETIQEIRRDLEEDYDTEAAELMLRGRFDEAGENVREGPAVLEAEFHDNYRDKISEIQDEHGFLLGVTYSFNE